MREFKKYRLALSKTHIDEIVRSVAKSIFSRLAELNSSYDYKLISESTVSIGLLHGVNPFILDVHRELIRTYQLELPIYYIRPRSYEGMQSTGKVTFSLTDDIRWSELKHKHILLFDDIFDTGKTILETIKLVETMQPEVKSITPVVLLAKSRSLRLQQELIKQRGMIIGHRLNRNSFVVGYGLDYNSKYRELDQIYEILEV